MVGTYVIGLLVVKGRLVVLFHVLGGLGVGPSVVGLVIRVVCTCVINVVWNTLWVGLAVLSPGVDGSKVLTLGGVVGMDGE